MTISNYIHDAVLAIVLSNHPEIEKLDLYPNRAKSHQDHDFQFSFPLKYAKKKNLNPIDFAQSLCCDLSVIEGLRFEASKPGFINVFVEDIVLSGSLKNMIADNQNHAAKNMRVIVDYSSPNIAKELHVGHLRSTIIGHALANIWEYCGADVLRLNHLGDFGTAFGMLLAYIEENHKDVFASDLDLSDLMKWYQESKAIFDQDKDFYELSKKNLIRLQAGDHKAVAQWKALCAISQQGYDKIYSQLGIEGLISRGESFYQPWLEEVIHDAQAMNVSSDSDGAVCIFLDGFKSRDGNNLPLIIQKSDGGYNYATTDLAAIKYRCQHDQADKIFYVTDSGQKDHFSMVFQAAKKLNYIQQQELYHVPFGVVQNPEGKRYKTRSGGVIRLQDLLDESYERAYAIAEDRGYTGNKEIFAKTVGIGALKYADLSTHRTMDYIFDFDRMLSFEGNTVVYILYSFVRTQSLLKKSGKSQFVFHVFGETQLEKSEKDLLLALDRFDDVLSCILKESTPHPLCDYLYQLSGAFHAFFRDCPVLNHVHSDRRLTIVYTVNKYLKKGLGLLGIGVLDEM